jgi:hypothetical protein
MRTRYLLALLVFLTACTSVPATSPAPTPAPAGGSCALEGNPFAGDADAVRAVLNAEGQFVVSQQIDILMRLWAEDGKVVDAKNTPDAADDQVWQGKDAIRNRYVRIVFPGAPAAVEHTDAEITVESDRAIVVAATAIGAEVSPAGDRWELIRQDGCWYLAGLTYNLEPHP